MTATISRLYNNYADAQEAVRSLEAAGIAHNDINIIASNADNWYSSDRKPGKDTFPDRDLDGKDDRAEAAGAGAGVGAAVGGTAGLLAGLGLMAIPGVGPFIAAGPIVAALSGAAVGAAVGGVAGGLIGLGIPEFEAKRYEGKVKAGNILLSVHTENGDEIARAKKIFEEAGAQDISVTGETAAKGKTPSTSPSYANR